MIVLHKSLYQKKLVLFEGLALISATMAKYTVDELIDEDGAAEDFKSLLQQREGLMARVDQLEQEIAVLEGQTNLDSSCNDLKGSLKEAALRVEALNIAIEAIVKEAVSELRSRTRRVREGRQSSRAYDNRVPSSEGAYVDKRR